MPYLKELDYCTYAPEGFFGVKFNYHCYLHDRQYRNEVKRRLTRKEADDIFRDRIYKMYIAHGMQRRGWVISRVYWLGVRLFGRFVWQ